MSFAYLFLFIVLVANYAQGQAGPLTDSSLGDEWIGPLPEWKWVTRDFGARGNSSFSSFLPVSFLPLYGQYSCFLFLTHDNNPIL
jgi:hypothetical protein